MILYWIQVQFNMIIYKNLLISKRFQHDFKERDFHKEIGLYRYIVGMYSTPHSGGYSSVVPPLWGVLRIRGGYNTTPHGTPQNRGYSGVLFSRWGYYLKSLKSKSTPILGGTWGYSNQWSAWIVEALRFKASSWGWPYRSLLSWISRCRNGRAWYTCLKHPPGSPKHR